MDQSQEAWVKSPLPFLHQLQELKHLPRTGWLRFVKDCETVASHSWRLAFLGLFAPAPLDKQRCMFIGLVHDVAESYAGDIPTFAGFSKDRKQQLERTGFKWIESLVRPGYPVLAQEVVDAWLDYEEGRTNEGRWMKQMDKLECLIQAKEYEERTYGEAGGLGEFQGLSNLVRDPIAKAWADLLNKERNLHLERRGSRLPIIFITGDEAWARKLCTLKAQDGSYQHTVLASVLAQRAEDPSFVHKDFLKYCLTQGFDVPKALVVETLGEHIRRSADAGPRWILLQGFPKTLSELVEFERKVQKQNFCINILTPDVSNPNDSTDTPVWQAEVDPTVHLKSSQNCYEEA
ncbi:ybr242w-like protein [Colletotrichum kahawae]|uniref:Ybr242w-like protein n=1 Tax=Colletotrichum kahawae TaxID=34407 RepID=A0AAD9YVY1_COLKA|nr:ybr242w-like protein [Colletotrichum kahawae]